MFLRASGRPVVTGEGFGATLSPARAADLEPSDRAEVAPIESDDLSQLQPLGERDERGIDSAERDVGVLANQLGHSRDIRSRHWNGVECVRGDGVEELRLDARLVLE